MSKNKQLTQTTAEVETHKYTQADFLDLSDEPKLNYRNVSRDDYITYLKWYKKKHSILEDHRTEHYGTAVERTINAAENVLDKRMAKLEKAYPDHYLIDIEDE
jgi:hypothetical protein